MRSVRLLSLVVLAAASVVGCVSGGTNPLEPPPPSSPLTVVPRSATLGGGQTIRLTATMALANGSRTTPENVRWSSADVGIATVSADGTVHALQAGRVLIIAEYKASRGSSLIQVAEQVGKKNPDVAKKSPRPVR
jgi:hypothetical protein